MIAGVSDCCALLINIAKEAILLLLFVSTLLLLINALFNSVLMASLLLSRIEVHLHSHH